MISRLLNLLYPSKCPSCGGLSDIFSHSPICSSCWSKITKYTGPSCKICAKPLTSLYAEICSECLKKAPPFSKVINYGLYEGVLVDAINHLKFNRLKRLAKPLSRLLLNFDFQGLDGVVPVPLSKKRLIERGFNQSLLFAQTISKEKKLPLFMDILLKVKETAPQTRLSGKERLSNLTNAFIARGNIKNLRLLLVDDVMTTGTTVTECSKQLIKAGAKDVVVLTLARVRMV
jgi:ComF family protein